jgi:hypothetical protein
LVSVLHPCPGSRSVFPCLTIVSRDRPHLLRASLSLYGHERGVQNRFDRRHGLPWTATGDPPARRSPPTLDTDLQDHGFIVIPRP